MDLQQEINNHLEWIDTVASLFSNEELMEEDFQEITQYDQCSLGHWLSSEDSQSFKDLPEFQQLTENHKAFHRIAGNLIASIQKGNEPEAIKIQNEFIQISHALISYLQLLHEKSAER